MVRLVLWMLLVAWGNLVAAAGEARAWGDQGHETICAIARQLVTPTTRSEIDRLIQADDEFPSFAASCSWPDHPRKRAAEHFLNLLRDSKGLTVEDWGGAPECVVSAISKDYAILSSADAGTRGKAAALKVLGRWVGDVHQPLHVSFADDRGGSDIKVTGECGPNLHAVWDTCLVRKAIGDDVPAAVDALLKGLTVQQRDQWAARDGQGLGQ